MKTFEEVAKYYTFPLQVISSCNPFIETANGDTAFNKLFPDEDDNGYYTKIVKKINEPQSIDLKDSFYIKEDRIVSKERNKPILLVRGWGMLIGTGANNLDCTTAAEIQDSFLRICCERLNTKI